MRASKSRNINTECPNKRNLSLLALFSCGVFGLKNKTMSKNVKVDELTIEGVVYVPKDSVKSTVIEINGDKSPWEIGKNYLIRTVTMIQLGKLKAITDKELVLSDACWVADTGRFHEALESGSLNEVEMFKRDVIIGRGALIDATEWLTNLPKESI